MVGTRKRAAEDSSAPATRSSKVAKTSATSSSKTGKAKGAKSAPPASNFKAKALPIHVNVTHTPPSIPDDETVPAATADPGFISAVTLVPSSFATGSYGWKGNKRITVELQNPNGGDEKEKVQVMLTINATVVGSKNAKGDENGDQEKAEDEAKAEEQAPENEQTEGANGQEANGTSEEQAADKAEAA